MITVREIVRQWLIEHHCDGLIDASEPFDPEAPEVCGCPCNSDDPVDFMWCGRGLGCKPARLVGMTLYEVEDE